MEDGRFLVFRRALLGRSVFAHVAPSRALYSRVSKRCEGFVAIWLRAREDIAHNRFQLLFINIEDIAVKPAFGGLHCYGAPSTAALQRCSGDCDSMTEP